MAELTVERLFSDPPLAPRLPTEPAFAPRGDTLAWLRPAADDRERQDLWRYDPESGAESLWLSGTAFTESGSALTDAEKAERERRRQFARGVTRFMFHRDGRRVIVPAAGHAFLFDPDADRLTGLTPAGTRQTDFRQSPDGEHLSCVRNGDLYVIGIADGTERRLTHEGGRTVSHGIADFIAQEEMHRFDGHWWSPDSGRIAYTRVDESPVDVSYRYEIDADGIRVVPQRYPYAGQANADVRLLVCELATGASTEIRYRLAPDDYLARVDWWGGRLLVQTQARDQQSLRVTAHDPASGAAELLFEERAPASWINLHDNFRAIDGERFLWSSERDGCAHLYLMENGALRQLTAGEGRVSRVLWADAGRALIAGWFDDPTEQHVYEVALAAAQPARPIRVTTTAGWHDAVASPDGLRLLDRSTGFDDPGTIRLFTRASRDAGAGHAWHTEPPRVVVAESLDEPHPYSGFRDRHATPRLGTIEAEDGQALYYRLTLPHGVAPPREGFPVIVHVYGGPGVQRVRNEWPSLLLQLFTRHGYAVFELDNRGSGLRCPAFEAPIRGRLGDIEVRDQLRGVEWLRSLDHVNAERVGVYGHSYGGYMAIMCMLKAADRFRAGAAVAPVTDWRLYDTHYTERYLGLPEANPDGYAGSSVFPWIGGLRGRLLLIHGMADDNVLFTHSTRLFHALQARHLPFDMMTYPGAKHALQERDVSIHRFDLILDFFGRHL
jgi:dipeptidyl-peptidase 4